MPASCHGHHWAFEPCQRRATCVPWDRNTSDAVRTPRAQLAAVATSTALLCASSDCFIPINPAPVPTFTACPKQQPALFA